MYLTNKKMREKLNKGGWVYYKGEHAAFYDDLHNKLLWRDNSEIPLRACESVGLGKLLSDEWELEEDNFVLPECILNKIIEELNIKERKVENIHFDIKNKEELDISTFNIEKKRYKIELSVLFTLHL